MKDVLPQVATQMRRLLIEQEERPDLASQVDELRVVALCPCGDDFCAQFDTAIEPSGGWSSFGSVEMLSPGEEADRIDLLIMIAGDQIINVEVPGYPKEEARALRRALRG